MKSYATPKNIMAVVIVAALVWGVIRGELTAVELVERLPPIEAPAEPAP